MNRWLATLVALTAFVCTTVQASKGDKHGHNAEAHVHGISELTIAMVDTTLEIQLRSPAMNLLGFEHKAKKSKDLEKAKKVSAQLRQAQSQFLLSSEGCELSQVSVVMHGLLDTYDYENDHDHGHKKHSEKPNHKHGHDHDAEQDESNGSHSEIVANYQYRCKSSTELKTITINLFESFPGIETIEVMWIHQARQGAAKLRPNNRVIKFR